MKIAFATTDMKSVNNHFGWAKKFALYEIDSERFTPLKPLEFEGTGDEETEEDKLNPRIEALSGCAIVYSANIGSIAAARLVKKRIHPMISKEQEPIETILLRLQAVLRGMPPPWLRKIMHEERKEVL